MSGAVGAGAPDNGRRVPTSMPSSTGVRRSMGATSGRSVPGHSVQAYLAVSSASPTTSMSPAVPSRSTRSRRAPATGPQRPARSSSPPDHPRGVERRVQVGSPLPQAPRGQSPIHPGPGPLRTCPRRRRPVRAQAEQTKPRTTARYRRGCPAALRAWRPSSTEHQSRRTRRVAPSARGVLRGVRRTTPARSGGATRSTLRSSRPRCRRSSPRRLHHPFGLRSTRASSSASRTPRSETRTVRPT